MTRTFSAATVLFIAWRRARYAYGIGERRLATPAARRSLLALSVAVLLSQMWLPDARLPLGMASGLAHLLGFHIVATLALLARPRAGIGLLLALIAFAAVVEGGQWFVPSRTVDGADLAFNLAGIAFAWLQRGLLRLLS